MNPTVKCLAVITARGGSKRIPRKNIKPFLGQPIIKYSIEAALQSGCFDEVMVSTDDKKIASIAESFGAKVPFFRSAQTSDDYAMTADVLAEVIHEYRKRDKFYERLCCIYPTAPFITAQRLRDALSLSISTDAGCVFPVVQYSYPVQRSLRIVNGRAEMLWPENVLKRSQDLEPVYHDAGQFYFMKTSTVLREMVLFVKDSFPIILSESEVQDIDNEEDWKVAEIKYKILTERPLG